MLEGKGYPRGCHKHCGCNIVDIIETTVVRVTTKGEVTILSHHKMYRATQRQPACEGTSIKDCSIITNGWDEAQLYLEGGILQEVGGLDEEMKIPMAYESVRKVERRK